MSSGTLSTGHKVGTHRIQGISDEFIPPIVHLAELDRVIAIDDGDAILMAQKLASHLGLGVGISSGANFLAALAVQDELGHDAVVVTIFCDSNKKYLSTDLLRDEPVKPEHRTPQVHLRSFRAINRVCDSCFDPSDPLTVPAGVYQLAKRIERRRSGVVSRVIQGTVATCRTLRLHARLGRQPPSERTDGDCDAPGSVDQREHEARVDLRDSLVFRGVAHAVALGKDTPHLAGHTCRQREHLEHHVAVLGAVAPPPESAECERVRCIVGEIEPALELTRRHRASV